MRVLLIDDSPDIRALAERVVRRRGHDVVACSDAESAWHLCQHETFSLVLLDWLLPGVDGVELCRRIRGLPDGDASVILMITGQSRPEDLTAALNAGASDYLAKPFSPAVLNVRLAVAERQVAEIARRRQAEQQLVHQARYDTLTGLPNRRHTAELLVRLLLVADRRDTPVTVAMVDLDHFKRINDRDGHAFGDAVLSRVGQLYERAFRGEDVVGRWGGEEFVIGLGGSTRRQAAHRMSGVLDAVGRETFCGSTAEEFRVTFSAGVAEYPADGSDLDGLLGAADAAMYRAKRGGRNRVVEWTPECHHSRSRTHKAPESGRWIGPTGGDVSGDEAEVSRSHPDAPCCRGACRSS